MRNIALGIIALFVGVGSVNAQSFTDLNAVAYRGKIKQKQMLTALDANFALTGPTHRQSLSPLAFTSYRERVEPMTQPTL